MFELRESMFCLIILNIILMSLPVYSVDPEVATNYGNIKGFTQRVNGVNVKTFLGVPFAKPPVDELRFRKPVSSENWTGTLETKGFANACHQPISDTFVGLSEEKGEEMWNPKTNMSEDCLYLNLWVPHKANDKKLATLVWIYGGGFSSGSTGLDVYDGKYLASSDDVIVVSISYRVGPLGFLYLDNEFAPGNMGLLDQNLGLKWVYENIEYFGGSRNLITIFGESAGAASVNYHLMSTLSIDYFQRAILQSGSSLSFWAFTPPDVAKTEAIKLASNLNCNKADTIDVIKCLKTIDAGKLIHSAIGPTIDKEFINKSPHAYVKEREIPKKELLLGVNRDEFGYFLLYNIFDENRHSNYDFSREEFLQQIPETIPQFSFQSQKTILLNAILQEYELEPYPYKGTYLDVLDEMGGDYWFKCPVIKVAQEVHKVEGSSSVYMYSFEHRSSSSSWPEWIGVLHGDEIEYVFGLPTNSNLAYTTEETDLSRKIMKYWTNFAKTGNPNGEMSDLPKWPEYTVESEQYIIFKTGNDFNTDYGLRHRQCVFWNDYAPNLRSALETSKGSQTLCSNGGKTIDYSVTVFMMVFLLLFEIRLLQF